MMERDSSAEMLKLTPEAREVLKRICAEHAAGPFAADAAERLRPVFLCRADQELALGELLRAGMLELRQKLWGEKLYQIPQQRLAMIQRSFWPPCPQRLEASAVKVESAACTGLAGELFKVLVLTAREGLPLTAKGVIHKKQMNRIASLLSMQEGHLAGLKLQLPGQELYPLPAAVMVDLMVVLGLAVRHSQGYLLDRAKLREWLSLAGQEMTDNLYRIAVSRYGAPATVEQHFRYLITAAEFKPGEWYAVSSVLEWMIRAGMALEQPGGGAAGSGREEALLAWLRCLAGFGWCELGSSAEAGYCFRWKAGKPVLPGEESERAESVPVQPQSAEAGRFIVQPDFEVLVPPDVPYPVRWTLAGCAELLHNDDLWSFRLTRERLESAAELGASPGEVIAWLAEHAQEGLPDQAEQSLRQWAGGIGRTALSEVILLSCTNETDSKDIAAHPRLQNIVTRIGPLHFIVRPDAVVELRKELAAAGLAPPKIIGGREEADEPGNPFEPYAPDPSLHPYRLPSPAEVQGLFGSAVYPQLPPVKDVPGQLLLPGEETVPQMWFTQWRQYHATTAQKVMEQALNWGIKAGLSIQGERAEFIPEALSGRPWRIRGTLLYPGSETAAAIELAAGDWQEMKLLHPLSQRNSSSADGAGYVMIR